MGVSVTNNGVTPANLVSLALPPSQLAGVVVGGDNRRTIDSSLPGESDIVEFRLLESRLEPSSAPRDATPTRRATLPSQSPPPPLERLRWRSES